MGTLMHQRNKGEKIKRYKAIAAAAGTGLLLVNGAWVLAIAGIGATGYFAYDWFKFRAQHGMRF